MQVVGHPPASYEEARDVAVLLAPLLARYHRILHACSGDREQASRVWAEIWRAETAA